MFALTVKNGHTRIYLTEGTQPASASVTDPLAANFWRTDMADQPAATLLASQAAGVHAPDPATHTFPATYTGWQCLTSTTTGDPYFATTAFCTQQCWYDQDVYTPAGLPDTVYVIGSIPVRRAAVQHERRRLRQRPLERPRGPLLEHRRRPGRLGDGRGHAARSPT